MAEKQRHSQVSEFIGYLNDAYDDFVRVAIAVEEVKAHERVFCTGFAANVDDLIVAKMFLNFRLQCE